MQTPAMTNPEQTSVALAFDLVAKLSDPKDIAARHGLNGKQLLRLVKNQPFQRLMLEAKRAWYSDTNASVRAKAKAALMVEDILIPLFAMVHDTELSPAARIAAARELMVIADMDGGEKVAAGVTGATPGELFSLTINIGTQEPTVLTANRPAIDYTDVEDYREKAA